MLPTQGDGGRVDGRMMARAAANHADEETPTNHIVLC